ERCSDRLLPGFQCAAQSGGILAACLSERGPASSASVDVLAEVSYELRRVEPTADERIVEVDNEIDTPIVHRTDDHAGGLLLLSQAIGQVPQRAALERPRLRKDDASVARHDLELRGRVRLRLLEF